jgi:hypothetical protein
MILLHVPLPPFNCSSLSITTHHGPSIEDKYKCSHYSHMRLYTEDTPGPCVSCPASCLILILTQPRIPLQLQQIKQTVARSRGESYLIPATSLNASVQKKKMDIILDELLICVHPIVSFPPSQCVFINPDL